MVSKFAALKGKTVSYQDVGDAVVIETLDGRMNSILKPTFDYLYLRLNTYTAALKEDCIRYAIYDSLEPLCTYPDWFIAAYDDGYIYEEEDYDTFIFYCEYGDILMDTGDVVLINYKNELNYLKRYQFEKFYDVFGD